MQEAMKPVMVKMEPKLIERADRLANMLPEYERSRSRLIRQGLREIVERLEAEVAKEEAA